jgi:diketogulonate reductase-like aldo/keto reductase
MIEFVGVSNSDVEQLKRTLRALMKYRIACKQVLYHLAYRGIELDLLSYCAENGIAIVGYSRFGHENFLSSHSRGKGAS